MKALRLLATCIVAVFMSLPAYGNELDTGINALQSGRFSEALKILVPLANTGNAEAQRIVGEMCYNGQGMKRDPVASFKWNELAAEGGNKIAQYNLGYLYEKGEGVSASRTEAINWYTKAAIQRYPPAQHKMGDLSSGREALYWYDQAQLNGDEKARKKFSSLSAEANAASAAAEKAYEIDRRKREAIAAQEDREFWQRKAKEREDDTPTPSYVQPSLADQMRTFQKIDREAANFVASVKSEQVAAQRQRDAQRNEEARQSRERQAQEDKRERDNQRRKEAERVARVTTAEVKNEAPRYQTPVATISAVSEKCPPGSSPARHPNGQYMTVPPSAYCIKDSPSYSNQTSVQGGVTVGATGVAGATPSRRTSNNNGSTGNDERVTSNTSRAELTDPKKKNIEWGPVKAEAIAVCRQSSKTNKWGCNGGLDNQIIMDEPTLESALKRQRCAEGSWTAGGPIIDGVKWEAYQCGHSLGHGDFDVAKRYEMTTARRSYMCPKNQPSDGRCATIYDGQDKR